MPDGSIPLRQFVVKVHGLCNLACDHCYVYELRDTRWRARPAVMAEPTMRRLVARIAEHAHRHRLPEVSVLLHGGEPFLAGRTRVDLLCRLLREALADGPRLRLSVQTNGTLLNEPWLELCHRHDIRVGVSLDGAAAHNDLHRRRRNGTSTHAAVERGLRLLRQPEHRDRYAGLLCTVDLRNPPAETYRALLEHEPPVIDLLLPHATWQFPPPGHDPAQRPYAAWLLAVFAEWYRTDAAPPTRIRFFEDLLDLSLGGAPRTEVVGGGPAGFAVVETDGSIHLGDAYRAVFDGASESGLDIRTADFDRVVDDPGFAEARLGRAGLAPECQACPVMDLCGGGMRAHRYRPSTGYRNRSVYCADLMETVTVVRDRVRSDLAPLLEGLR
ncbi:uncharacterized protein ABH931_003692 [Streptacidiphilus sp. MAP12-33]|uniref:FxsB family cyclophane-forming radical SAM/SPASM peptide maturase n=1 Tax=Streptacidiphilus sp. MAP12-33 TaxID=3156266 RepID=UPI0035120EA7